MAGKKEKEIIEIRQMEIAYLPIRIVGDSPLICHAWSAKARRLMLAAQMRETKTKAKEKREPVAEFIRSLYWLAGEPEEETEAAFERALKEGAKFGFPAGGIKQAANSAAYRLGWVPNQTALRGTYFLKSEFGEMVEIKGDSPVMREDMVRLSGIGRSADLRYRGEFRNWYMDCILEYSRGGAMTVEQIVNCINAGGYAVGIGEWRPERDGTFGRFHVEPVE